MSKHPLQTSLSVTLVTIPSVKHDAVGHEHTTCAVVTGSPRKSGLASCPRNEFIVVATSQHKSTADVCRVQERVQC